MDIAIITGVNTGVGLEIARKLVEIGYKVYGLAKDFKLSTFNHKGLSKVNVDTSDLAALEKAVQAILLEEKGPIDALIHVQEDAEMGLSTEQLIQAQFTGPMRLTELLLPNLRKYQGYCIYVSQENGKNLVHKAYKAGLQKFFEAIFDQYRDEGVKVSNVSIESNAQGAGAKVNPYDDPQSVINPKTVARCIEKILRYREGNIISHMVVRPQATSETPKLGRSPAPSNEFKEIQLPSVENFAREPDPILTPEPKPRHAAPKRPPQRQNKLPERPRRPVKKVANAARTTKATAERTRAPARAPVRAQEKAVQTKKAVTENPRDSVRKTVKKTVQRPVPMEKPAAPRFSKATPTPTVADIVPSLVAKKKLRRGPKS